MRSRSIPKLATLIVALGTSAAMAATAEATPAQLTFDRHQIALGIEERQTVLTGFFFGGVVADIAVVHIDESGDRRLRIFALGESTWTAALDATLGSEVMFVDVADIRGRDRLITYTPGHLNWFDPESGTERPLVEVAMDYNSRHDHEGSPTQPAGKPPHVDITRDLNHDGREDVLVPDLDGFWISIQRSDGSFTEAVKLGPPEPCLDELVGNLNPGGGASDDSRTYRDVGITASTLPLYLSRVHEMDYDQ
ncbi:MAG: hypothetical protein ACE5GX_00290, partial [Thermoanaerobaculia bacterium]